MAHMHSPELGAAFLSAFPDEAEILYSPLCFLQPTGKKQMIEIKGVEFSVVEVIPHFAS